MSNSATVRTERQLRDPLGLVGKIIPYTIVLDTAASDLTIKAAVPGKIIAVVGGSIQNEHASGTNTLLFKSDTVEIFRETVLAQATFSPIYSNGARKIIATWPGEALKVQATTATNLPLNGTLYLAVFEGTGTGSGYPFSMVPVK